MVLPLVPKLGEAIPVFFQKQITVLLGGGDLPIRLVFFDMWFSGNDVMPLFVNPGINGVIDARQNWHNGRNSFPMNTVVLQRRGLIWILSGNYDYDNFLAIDLLSSGFSPWRLCFLWTSPLRAGDASQLPAYGGDIIGYHPVDIYSM